MGVIGADGGTVKFMKKKLHNKENKFYGSIRNRIISEFRNNR